MDKQKILNRYSKPEDKLLISKMLDKIELAKTKNKIQYTDFLDGYQKHLLEKILIQENQENYIISGGLEEAERNAIVFYPEKLKEVAKVNYQTILPIVCLRIQLPKEMYGQYSHRDYLGGLIKLGIKREKIGDILVFEDGADILILEEIAKFLSQNLNTLTRFSKSKIEQVSTKEVREKCIQKQEMQIIVASMRLDSVIAEILRTSRGKAEEIIKEARVFINFENVDKLTKQVKENDLITIRGKGRFEIGMKEGLTKNGRIKITVYQYV